MIVVYKYTHLFTTESKIDVFLFTAESKLWGKVFRKGNKWNINTYCSIT